MTSENELADRWAAIEIRLVKAEQRLHATIAAGHQNIKAASSSTTADAGGGLQTSNRWTAIEQRLCKIEQRLSLPTNALLSNSIPIQPAYRTGPEDAPAATQQRAPPEPAAQSTNGALRPGWVDAIPSPTQQRLETELKEKGVPFTFLRVEDGYYNRSLEERRSILGAASIQQLCKSMLMVNTKAPPGAQRHFLIIIQYASSIQAEALKKHVIAFEAARGRTLSRKQCNMRLAPESESTELTGFEHNAVSPVGLREEAPMVVTEEVAQLPHMWLGGGEPDLKLGMPVPAFLAAYHAAVVDCSDRKRTVEDT